MDLLPDLVAAGARARADRGGDRAVGAELAQRGDALGDDAAREPAPAAVERGDRAVGGEQRPAGSRRRRRARRRPSSAVAWPSSSAAGAPVRRLGRAPDRRAVDLAAVAGSARAATPTAAATRLAVRVDGGGVVVGEPAEVERGERAGARRRRGAS